MKVFEIREPKSKNALDLLAYEIRLLNRAHDLAYAKSGTDEGSIALESFLIHARNLISFLGSKGRRDELKCSDFTDRQGKNFISIKTTLPSTLYDDISQRCHHIVTTKRLGNKLGWPVDFITKQINIGINQFIEQLNKDYNFKIKKQIEDITINFIIPS